MAPINMDYVQIWQPTKLTAYEPQAASSQRDCRTGAMTSQLARQHTDTIQALEHDSQGISGDDFDKIDDYFPPVEELVATILQTVIIAEEHKSSPRHHSLSEVNDAISNEEGTQDYPVIIEDDEDDCSTDFEVASTDTDLRTSSEDTSLSSILDGRRVTFDPRITDHPSPTEHYDGEVDFTVDDEPGLPIELEDPVPTNTANLPYPNYRSGEPSHDENNDQDQAAISQSASEQASPITQEASMEKWRKHEWEQMHPQKEADRVGNRDIEDEEDDENQMIERRGASLRDPKEVEVAKKRRVVQLREEGEGTEIHNCVRCSDKEYSPDPSDDDDESPQPTKRQRRSPDSHHVSQTSNYQRGLKPSPRWAHSQSCPAVQEVTSPGHTEERHGSLHTAIDNSYSCSLHTPRSGSPPAITDPQQPGGAEYLEWGVQHGSLKRTIIGDQTVFQLQFSLKDLHDLLAVRASSHMPLDTCQTKTPTRSAHSYRLATQTKKGRPGKRQQVKRGRFTTGDDAKLVELKERQGLSWKDIALQFPGRSSGGLQVRYCTKLKKRCLSEEDERDLEE